MQHTVIKTPYQLISDRNTHRIKHIAMILFFTAIIMINPSSAQTEPFCERVLLPFLNESDVYYEIEQWLDCGYEFWKEGHDAQFDGVQGFRKMFGEDGYIWNTSTVMETDSETMSGYQTMETDSVVTQSLIQFTSRARNITIYDWNEYEVWYSWIMDLRFVLGDIKSSIATVETVSYRKYYSDGSGTVEKESSNSSQHLFGVVVHEMFKTTASVAEKIGVFDDDEIDTKDAIVSIFLCVFGIAAFAVVVVICTFIGCTVRKMNRFHIDQTYLVEDVHGVQLAEPNRLNLADAASVNVDDEVGPSDDVL